MLPILLINPNTSSATTDRMVAVARATAGSKVQIRGETAAWGPPMITTAQALHAAEAVVVDIGLRETKTCSGVIVAAFGDPGALILRRRLAVPVVGICEAAMIEAVRHGRFAVATTTPELVTRIAESATRLGLADHYAGTWLTEGNPLDLAGDPQALANALAGAVAASLREGGAACVIIGGGPLSDAAIALSSRFRIPIIVPVAAAVRHLIAATLR